MPNSTPESRAAEQLAQAEALFKSIGEGAIATDEFGRITRVNPIALTMLGYQEKDLIGDWLPNKLVATDEKGIVVNLIERPITKAFLTGRSVTEKLFYRKKDGEKLPVIVTVSPIMLAERPIGAIEVFRDITVEEEIDRMKSEFISLASHQLRTPLSAIKTYSHMLVDGYMGDVTPAQRKSLRTIIGATNRMNELISTLLNITRIESGTIVINLRMQRVERAAEEVMKELAMAASEKQITLSLQQIGKLATSVKTDNLIFKEILTNLVTNAIKYTDENGMVTITVQGRIKDVLITVKDDGWGIPAESHSQVFSKFFRAQNTVKRETTGTGLGLYLVKGLLERLDGTISFQSEEGKGTTFSVTLPKEHRKRKN